MRGKYIVCIGVGILFIGMYILGYKIGRYSQNDIRLAEGTQVAKSDEEIIGSNAEYLLEIYNNDTNETMTKTLDVPVEFIGFTRDRLIEYISTNKNYFCDTGEEIKNVMLVSFSKSKIVIRKSVVDAPKETKSVTVPVEDEANYFIFLEEGFVVVYKKDRTTLFLETGITEAELEHGLAAELSLGVAVKDISELYRLLESYTS